MYVFALSVGPIGTEHLLRQLRNQEKVDAAVCLETGWGGGGARKKNMASLTLKRLELFILLLNHQFRVIFQNCLTPASLPEIG